MMEVLKEHGIEPFYDKDFEVKMKRTVRGLNRHYYEHNLFVYNGFGENHVEQLEGKAIKILTTGIKHLPKCEYKMIFMSRPWAEISRSMSQYTTKEAVEAEYKIWRKTSVPEMLFDHNALLLPFSWLLNPDEELVSLLSGYLGIEMSLEKIEGLIIKRGEDNEPV